eukprot:1415049-Prymnesium_polylepis.1
MAACSRAVSGLSGCASRGWGGILSARPSAAPPRSMSARRTGRRQRSTPPPPLPSAGTSHANERRTRSTKPTSTKPKRSASSRCSSVSYGRCALALSAAA